MDATTKHYCGQCAHYEDGRCAATGTITMVWAIRPQCAAHKTGQDLYVPRDTTGNRLRAAREAAGFTPLEASKIAQAEMPHVMVSNIQKWEGDLAPVPTKTYKLLMHAYTLRAGVHEDGMQRN